MKQTIQVYNQELERWRRSKNASAQAIDEFVTRDAKKISWSSSLKADFGRKLTSEYRKNALTQGLYRPFNKQWLYFDNTWNHRVGLMPKYFPGPQSQNLIICLSSVGAQIKFSCLMSDTIANQHTIQTGQCFPLYIYDAPKSDLFNQGDAANGKLKYREAITDAGLKHFIDAYAGEKISKEDLFYYIYGLLHSPEYQHRYADNLSKELPRIPRVKSAKDFWAFSNAGRALGELHVNYEKQKKYGLNYATKTTLKDTHYSVEKMRYNADKTAIIYNTHLTLEGIPLETHEYVVNGKSALDWVVERYCIKTDKDSGIVNDANAWALETEKNPRYIVELIERIVTVSLETMKIVNGLPALSILEGAEA